MSTEATTVEVGNFRVSSNTESAEEIRGSLGEPEAISEAAAELGKKGGEASAAKRATEAKEAAKEAKAKPAEDGDEPDVSDDEPKSDPAANRESEATLGKPRHDPKARMLEATRKEAEAKRERDAARADADAARKERDELKAKVEAAKAPAKLAEAPAKDAKPVQDDPNFASYDEFVEALTDWKADQKHKEWEAKAEQTAKVKEYAKGIDEQLGRALAARKEYEKTDPAWFGKISEEVKTLANNPSVARDPEEKLRADHIIADEIILADEKDPSKAVGPRLMLHLTDHPDEFQRLRALHTPTEIQVEMRILARSLNGAVTAGAVPKAQVSKASPPLRPVSGSPHTADRDELDDDAPLSEHVTRWGRREQRSQR